jgi:hypothetical protein
VVWLVCSAAASARRPIVVTFVGDSVPAALDYVPAAREELSRGLVMRLDLLVCRRLATESCSFAGSTPPSALETVRDEGRELGQILIIDVGYNDSDASYREGMAEVVEAAEADGVRAIIWVNLRETRSNYYWTNVAIRAEAERRRFIQVLDWNAASRGRPWFASDGLHLNAAGAEGLAALLRPLIFELEDTNILCGSAAASPPQTVCVRPSDR